MTKIINNNGKNRNNSDDINDDNNISDNNDDIDDDDNKNYNYYRYFYNISYEIDNNEADRNVADIRIEGSPVARSASASRHTPQSALPSVGTRDDPSATPPPPSAWPVSDTALPHT